MVGYFFPWVIQSETLHYGYALVMLIGLWTLRSGFTGVDRRWWTIALAIQFFHHFEHFLLHAQATTGYNLAGTTRADEHRADVGAARRTAPLLQHDRVHSDGRRDVLPHVSAGRGEVQTAVLLRARGVTRGARRARPGERQAVPMTRSPCAAT